jgi:hypothetical protein
MLRPAPWLALLAPLLLTGCSGFAVFLDDVHSPSPHANDPIGNSENIRRVAGKAVAIEPLQPVPGNVWPGPIPPQPTLEDLAKQPMQPVPPLDGTPSPNQSTLPPLVVPMIPHHLQPRPGEDMNLLNGPLPTGPVPPAASPQGAVEPTPNGPAVGTKMPSGLGAAGAGINPSDKSQPIVVPNGNGTSTVIAPDGTITTIPTPNPSPH